MKIKSKLQLGIGLLFLLNLIVGVLAGYYLQQLSEVSQSILTSNYKSLQYVRQLNNQLNKSGDTGGNQMGLFEKYLRLQEENVTEPGERAATEQVRRIFKQTGGSMPGEDQKIRMEKSIDRIEKINLKAIYIKNIRSQQIAENVTLVLGLITAFCLLVGFSFMVNFPGYIANPLQELLAGIKAIANKQYNQQLKIYTDDELGELATAYNGMAQKLGEYESSNLAKVLFEKRRIETIINSMTDGVIGFDADDKILFVNPIGSDLLKLSKADEGKNAQEVAARNRLFDEVFRKEDHKEIEFSTRNGECFFAKETIEVKNQEEAIGKVMILNNITSFHELDAAKTNFIATISHELKTPISSIKLSLKLLEDERIGKVNEEQQSLIQNIRDDATRLLRITGELLDLSQLESGNIHLTIQEAPAMAIVDYARTAVQFQADQKAVKLNVFTEEGISTITADEEKTAWVLVNFLSNALRYSPSGSKILIQVRLKRDMVEFTVTDEGPGIELQYQKKIFERYFQVPSESGKKTGTGLGLAISKDFIEAQKGQIFVISKPGKGSTFGFTIPKTRADITLPT
ncbi:HAMP domain-containing sensor histidine kinase [Desertivirga arenae]|uniref:HAMP domain-containing sensor histidine kinase n=1 Tax=Desertivirga arenae TaxID=2810309 RepID=UPI001A964282|nr:ATP-binding protein [Pedobacter sp. SYSU D00823]